MVGHGGHNRRGGPGDGHARRRIGDAAVPGDRSVPTGCSTQPLAGPAEPRPRPAPAPRCVSDGDSGRRIHCAVSRRRAAARRRAARLTWLGGAVAEAKVARGTGAPARKRYCSSRAASCCGGTSRRKRGCSDMIPALPFRLLTDADPLPGTYKRSAAQLRHNPEPLTSSRANYECIGTAKPCTIS